MIGEAGVLSRRIPEKPAFADAGMGKGEVRPSPGCCAGIRSLHVPVLLGRRGTGRRRAGLPDVSGEWARRIHGSRPDRRSTPALPSTVKNGRAGGRFRVRDKKLRNISYDFNTKTVSNATLIKRVGYIIRNTLTILAYTAGVINYNKYEVYDICKSIPGFYIPFSKESYIKLLDIKSYIKDNSLDADSIPNFHQYIKLWIKKAFLLVRSSYYKIIALTSRGFSSPFIDYL